MKRTILIFTSLGLLLVAHSGWAAMGTAYMKGTTDDSELSGFLKLEDTKEGLKITGEIKNIVTGEHGFHIHEFGECTDEGKAAGGHYNPEKKPHGHVMKDGIHRVHPGDMGNLNVKEDGIVTVSVLIPGLTLAGGKFSVAGRAMIIHEKKDDFGQPTGNAGGRIGCGTIILSGQ